MAPDEARHERIGGTEIDVLRRADLRDVPVVDHRDPVGERERFRLVMRDIDRGDADLALQPLELAAHLVAQLGIEIRERLVEQQQPRLVHDRARERDPLLLAAGQPRCRALLEAIEIDDRERALARRPRSRPWSSAAASTTVNGNATFSATVMCGQIA